MSDFWTWFTTTWRERPAGCWVWRGRRRFRGQNVRAVAAEFAWGWRGGDPAPLHPTCGERRCVRPEHLSPEKPGRGRRLSAGQAAEVRAAYRAGSREVGARALARKYGVCLPTIQKILAGTRYK